MSLYHPARSRVHQAIAALFWSKDVLLRPTLVTVTLERHSTLRNMRLVVNIDVDDLEKAIEFYSRALGLRLSRRLFDGSVAEMTGADSTIHLLLKPAESSPVGSATVIRNYDRHWTPVHLDFTIEDIFAAVQRAVAAGAILDGQVQSYEWGHLATLSDPFGHGFCLLQFLGPGYEEAAER